MGLTAKQSSFVQYYADPASETYNNATQSAIKANYSKKTAKQIGQNNLTKIDIKNAIAEFKAKIAEKIEITREWVIEKLKEVITNPDRNTDKVAALRELSDIMGFHRELAENPENVANQQALTKAQTEQIREIARQITQERAEKDAKTTQKPALKIARGA